LYQYSADEFRAMSAGDIEVEEQCGPEAALMPPGVKIWRHRTGDGRLIDVEAAVHDTEFNGKPARLAVLLAGWMSWHREATKDAVACDKPRLAGKRALIRGFPNEETRLGA
jgi:hypothetical protein